MYQPLSCRPKFNRVLEDEEEDIENVNDEINFIINKPSFATTFIISNTMYHTYQIVHESTLFKIASKLLVQAEEALESDTCVTSLSESTTYIIDLLKSVRSVLTRLKDDTYKSILHKNLSIFKGMITHITELKPIALIKLLGVKQAENPISQYLHLYIDIIWLLATIDEDVSSIIIQLTFLAFKNYDRNKNYLTCSCVKTMWLRLQLYCECRSRDFWGDLNSALECHNEEFCVQFTCFAAKLQCYNDMGRYVGPSCSRIVENFEFFNEKWSSYLKNEPSELALHAQLGEIKTLYELWLDFARLDFLYATWDYFFKRLESMASASTLDVKDDNAYHCFLSILKMHLGRHPQHWNKFRGRIYTRFAKFAKLNENGVYNVALLLISVIDANFDEVETKMLDFMSSLPPDRQNTVVFWNVHITLIKMSIKNGRSTEKIEPKLLEILNETVKNRTRYNLVATFVSSLPDFFSDNINLKHSQFIGPWIEPYAKTCSINDLNELLNALIRVGQKIISCGAWQDYENAFMTHILPVLKRIAVNTSKPELVVTLSALIASKCNCALISTYFTECVPAAVTMAYFTTLLKRLSTFNSDTNFLIVKAWFQCLLIGEQNPDFDNCVLHICNTLYQQCETNLKSFLTAISKDYDKHRSTKYFTNLDKFLNKNLGSEDTNMTIYTNMVMVFELCGSLLYSRIDSSCPLSKIIDLLLLTSDLLRGYKPPSAILKPIEKTWVHFMEALFRIAHNDVYIERVLKDMVIKYLPHFELPLWELCNDELYIFVVRKINLEFFGGNRNPDEQISKALLCVKNAYINSDINRSGLICVEVLQGLFEVYMFKNIKVGVIDVLKCIVNSDHYKCGHLKVIFKRALTDISKKHLPFNTNCYFQMVYVLTKLIPDDLRGILDIIRNEICVVEAKRGQGFDNSLRQGFEKLQNMLNE